MKHWLKEIRTRRRITTDLSEELQQHLEEKIEALVESGMPREEAIHAARRAFGNATLIEQRSREVWMWPFIESLWADIKFAFRQLRKSPGFAITAILTLALAIGANTAIFSVVNALMLRPLAYPHPDRLGALITHWTSPKGVEDDDSANGQTFEMVRDQVPAVTSAAEGMESGVNLQAGTSVQYVQQLRVSSKYFHVLGPPPQMGRGFTSEEERPHG